MEPKPKSNPKGKCWRPRYPKHKNYAKGSTHDQGKATGTSGKRSNTDCESSLTTTVTRGGNAETALDDTAPDLDHLADGIKGLGLGNEEPQKRPQEQPSGQTADQAQSSLRTEVSLKSSKHATKFPQRRNKGFRRYQKGNQRSTGHEHRDKRGDNKLVEDKPVGDKPVEDKPVVPEDATEPNNQPRGKESWGNSPEKDTQGLEQKLRDREEEAARLTKDNEAVRNYASLLRDENAGLQGEIQGHRARINHLEAALNNEMTAVAWARQGEGSFKKELDRKAAELSKAKNRIRDLEKDLRMARGEGRARQMTVS